MIKRLATMVVLMVLVFGLRLKVGGAATIPQRTTFQSFPTALPGFPRSSGTELDERVEQVLAADDTLTRTFIREDGIRAELFVAYYKVQRAGEAMHSPKNCLPGWGWRPIENNVVPINPGDPAAGMMNRYLVEKDGNQALVLYWYQANGRTIASEYWGKAYLVWDALMTGRRDGAIVRIVVSVDKQNPPAKALQVGQELASDLTRALPPFIPH